ncbi:ABC transporter ATP-binding protein [Pseudonocardia ailaonensis]|uniref:ABC transporter ATP-binding protein n=1 Tax=Pseudonocardia ailaonensis TaxID=367279 RepID=A0ABN2N4P9_9PSEU
MDESTPVAIRGLVKAYGAIRAVDGVDLEIGRGEVVALLGPNGAGKSTTIDALLGLTRPDEGEVRLFGRSPREAVAGGSVGAMLQSGGFPDDATAGELVKLTAALFKKPARPAIERAGITGYAGQRYGRLSGGQKQRVRFAVALVGDPELLVLDEPTAAMDVGARREFWAAMREYGRTVLFATHYLAEAEEFADRVVLLRAGRVVADGSVAEVRALAAGRVVSAVIPAVPGADDREIDSELATLPGVTAVARQGRRSLLTCDDSDTALRALLLKHETAHDIEVTAHGLEDAFVQLTGEDN